VFEEANSGRRWIPDQVRETAGALFSAWKLSRVPAKDPPLTRTGAGSRPAGSRPAGSQKFKNIIGSRITLFSRVRDDKKEMPE